MAEVVSVLLVAGLEEVVGEIVLLLVLTDIVLLIMLIVVVHVMGVLLLLGL